MFVHYTALGTFELRGEAREWLTPFRSYSCWMVPGTVTEDGDTRFYWYDVGD